MTGINITGLQKSYGDKVVLDNVSLEVGDGEFICLLGPSGCGKSTLLRSIAGLETPEGGIISLGTHEVFNAEKDIIKNPEDRQLGMVFQSFALWPHKSVFENVAYPLRRAKVPKNEIKERVDEALSLVDLAEHRDKYPGMLSGGQQQRVSLARAVVARPRLLLLDEPLSALDTNLRAQMRREVRRIQQKLGATAVYVTHDKEDAGGLADRVFVLQDGNIVQQGQPREVFVQPKTAFVAEFVGFDNFFTSEIVEKQGDLYKVRLANGDELLASSHGEHQVGEKVSSAVRSRLIRVRPAESERVIGAFTGELLSKVHLGDDVELVISSQNIEIVARVRPGYARGLQVGQLVHAEPPEGTTVLVEGIRKGSTQ